MADSTPAERLAEQKRRRRPPRNRHPPSNDGVWVCHLRTVRERHDLSLRDVAEALGMSVAGLHQIEHGGDPMLSTAHRIAAFFGLSVHQIWPRLR